MELETQLTVSEKLKYLSPTEKEEALLELTDIAKMLNGLIAFQKKKLFV